MKRIQEKAFTLIELLAVIIVLAIVALIATPIILDVIGDARISAGKSEANMILGGINNYCASEEMKYQLDNSYERICTSSMDSEDVKEMVNLGNATINELVYDGEKLTTLVITSNNHKFTLCSSGIFAMDNEECDDEVVTITTGPIKNVVLSNFPELELGENGCKNSTENNYSYSKGCYLKGNPTNNYIWYSGFLWRIMGINADGTVRMITEDNITSIPWGSSTSAENWDESYAKDWLNNYFYPRLKGNNIVKEETWFSETTTDRYSARINCENNLSIQSSYAGLMTLDEYNLAGGSGSYLNIGQYQWTMTPNSSSNAWHVYVNGSAIDGSVSNLYGLRAVINVIFDANITGGNGTLGATWSSQSGPYILNEDKNIEVTGKLNEEAVSGEYVLFAGKKYRVVDKDSNGNTKLILDGYYEENEGTIYKMSYGLNSIFSTTTGIGQKLNGDVLNWLTNNSESEKGKLVADYTWYQNNFASGYDYKISLNEENPTGSVQATVGLIRVGEMLSGQSSSILTSGYKTTSSYFNANSYWTMTPYIGTPHAWLVLYNDYVFFHSISAANSLRAVIVVTADVTVTGGNGTWSSPYKI